MELIVPRPHTRMTLSQSISLMSRLKWFRLEESFDVSIENCHRMFRACASNDERFVPCPKQGCCKNIHDRFINITHTSKVGLCISSNRSGNNYISPIPQKYFMSSLKYVAIELAIIMPRYIRIVIV